MDAKTILVVEDELRMRKLIGITLRNRGYQVMEAGDVSGAAKKIGERLPDAVVLDAMLPDRMGFEMCVSLKEDPLTKDIPIIMISGITQGVPGSSESWKRKFHADDYISKPFTLKELVDCVERLLDCGQRGGRP